jgi:hypothetical protein
VFSRRGADRSNNGASEELGKRSRSAALCFSKRHWRVSAVNVSLQTHPSRMNNPQIQNLLEMIKVMVIVNEFVVVHQAESGDEAINRLAHCSTRVRRIR